MADAQKCLMADVLIADIPLNKFLFFSASSVREMADGGFFDR